MVAVKAQRDGHLDRKPGVEAGAAHPDASLAESAPGCSSV